MFGRKTLRICGFPKCKVVALVKVSASSDLRLETILWTKQIFLDQFLVMAETGYLK